MTKDILLLENHVPIRLLKILCEDVFSFLKLQLWIFTSCGETWTQSDIARAINIHDHAHLLHLMRSLYLSPTIADSKDPINSDGATVGGITRLMDFTDDLSRQLHKVVTNLKKTRVKVCVTKKTGG